VHHKKSEVKIKKKKNFNTKTIAFGFLIYFKIILNHA